MRYALIHEMLGAFLVKLSVWHKKKKKWHFFKLNYQYSLKRKKNKVAHDEGSNLGYKDTSHPSFHYATS